MPETSTVGIFQVAFISRQMEQTLRAFFQTTFEPIGRACAVRRARGGLGLQGKWRMRACVPHTPYMWATAFLDLPLIEGRLKSKKAACTICFPCRTLNPQQPPRPLSPWERVRERATRRKACIGAVRVLGKIAEIRGIPSPQPSPTGEGADCSRFKCYRSSEKECPKYQQLEFFRQPLLQGRQNKRRERFFRRPLNLSVGYVPQGTHVVGWGCRENGERVRIAHTLHTGYGLLSYFIGDKNE